MRWSFTNINQIIYLNIQFMENQINSLFGSEETGSQNYELLPLMHLN